MSEKQADKKPGIMQRAKRFTRSSLNELKKVHWPNKSELITYTAVVIVSVFVMSGFIWIIDSIVSYLFGLLA